MNKIILLTAVLFLALNVSAQGKKYGLFVGINAYAGNELNGMRQRCQKYAADTCR